MIVLKSGLGVWIEQLVFAPNGTALAAPAGFHGVLIWNDITSAAKPDVLAVPIRWGGWRFAYTANGEFLLIGDDKLKVVRLATRTTTQYYPVTSWNYELAPTPDSAHVIVCERHSTVQGQSVRYRCWSLRSHDSPMWTVDSSVTMQFGPFFVSDSQFVVQEWRSIDVATQGASFLCVRSATNGQIISEKPAATYLSGRVILSPDATLLAGYSSARIQLQSVSDPLRLLPEVRNDGRKHFTGLAFHPSGRYLAATSNDETVKLYDTTTWEVARTFTWKIGRMRSIAFSPDGMLAAAGGDKGQVVVWDVDV